MLKITCGDNMHRETKMVNSETTLRSVLESCRVDYTKGITSLDGSPLTAGDLDKTFAQFNITEKAFLLNVVKADNA